MDEGSVCRAAVVQLSDAVEWWRVSDFVIASAALSKRRRSLSRVVAQIDNTDQPMGIERAAIDQAEPAEVGDKGTMELQ